MAPLRMAIAHEWLDQPAGSEKTFIAMAEQFADADLFALSNALPDDVLPGRPIRTTFIPSVPVLRSRRDLALPLMPLAWRRLARQERYDLVITSSHACVKGFRPARAATHLSYCYTPMRYVWEPDDDRGGLHRAARLGPAAAMRAWDRRSADWVDDFAAISSAVQDRIADHYDRASRVIHPPVDTDYYTAESSGGGVDGQLPFPANEYVLACSRFIPYKRLDLAVAAAARADVPIVVAGHGPAEAQLRAAAKRSGAEVSFVHRPSDAELRALYRGAAAFVFPPHEDFGIVAVEAQACGTPVVAFAAGGSLDTVVDGVTGALAPSQDAEAFGEALVQVLSNRPDPAACVANAERFSRARFQQRVAAWVHEFR